ncbi:MAG: DUF1080 domain-containing protein [Bryobacter sp.]|nr:DUF1080 domain-containing protein [Bryobacter sp.]
MVCWRDIHTADILQINGAEQVAGSLSGKRDTLRLALEVTIGVAKANAQAWKASCVWIPRAPRIEVPGLGKDEIWRADSTWGDVADGLQASLVVTQRQIKPGDDITLTMNLRNVRPARGDAVNDPIRVWDNKYSEGYRADFYLVVTPDGQSRILRRAMQPGWDKNVPTPITIEPGKSWMLAGIANDAIVKSLKSLGLDTSKEGIYTITGYYEADASPGPKPTGPIPFWGGQIATPPVEIRVGEGEFKAPAPDKIKAAADAQTLYLGSPITVEGVATAAPAHDESRPAKAGKNPPVPLFDGKTFTGWEGDTAKTWRIENGEIVAGKPDVKQPRNEFLCTTRDYADFELQLEYRRGDNNGGIQFRSERVPKHHEVSGYQADFAPGVDGCLYDESRRNRFLAVFGVPEVDLASEAGRPGALIKQAQALRAENEKKLKIGEWNRYRIRAEGPRIRLWINDVLTVDYTEKDPKIPLTGKIAVQIHSGATEIRYRNIVIEELNAKPAATP